MILQYTNFKTDYIQVIPCQKTIVKLSNNNQLNKSTVQQINNKNLFRSKSRHHFLHSLSNQIAKHILICSIRRQHGNLYIIC